MILFLLTEGKNGTIYTKMFRGWDYRSFLFSFSVYLSFLNFLPWMFNNQKKIIQNDSGPTHKNIVLL